MLLIICPHCGPRASVEFSYHGEGSARPAAAEATPQSWRAYLYEQGNLAGKVREEWFHVSGCRRFLVIERDTLTNQITSVRDRAGA